MTVVKGIIREIGQSKTTRVSARRWIGSTRLVIQDESTMQTYSVRISAKTMDKYHFLPRVGMQVILHGYVEEAEYSLWVIDCKGQCDRPPKGNSEDTGTLNVQVTQEPFDIRGHVVQAIFAFYFTR